MNVLLVAVVEAVTEGVNVEVEVEVLVVAAGVVLMVDLMVVPMVVLSEIKYERSSSFLAKGFLAKKLSSAPAFALSEDLRYVIVHLP